ncbi:class I SAM-dependent methyltransferase [Candidatus Peregrinibacteria bacterium]|nr:class I SAM-dependent methyltransferase [Candidatus Peregrinibacteria bacterium]
MHSIDDVLKKNLNALRPYIFKNNIEAYRILNYVDIYKDNAVIHVFDVLDEDSRKSLEQSLKKIVGVRYFFYKNRTKENITLPQSAPKEIIINEYGHKFLINLSDYLDTGIFLDHRETRKWIGELSRGKTVLNTFAYTGSFSVYAAKGGATFTHSVDLSKTYCEWMKKNFELNKMDLKQNWVLKMDTREYFKYARKKRFAFDIIIIDPPTFSRNKGKFFSVQRDHPELINEALSLLTPAGFILFSNNYTEFSLQKNKLNSCTVRQKFDTLPPDFKGTRVHQCFIITRGTS